jgi:NADPH:quinone reductase-like Zn-dependent oxidoreductase
MKAIVCTGYGSPRVLQFADVEKPTPGDEEILVRVRATSVTVADVRVRGFRVPLWFWLQARAFLGLRRPKRKILGAELAGDVEAVGKNVKLFHIGDQVFAGTEHIFGAYAEYRCFPETAVVTAKPSNLTYEEAATIPLGGLTALYFLRMGNIQRGQKVLVYGASGSVGAFAVQLAKHFGAEVTAVCGSTNLDLAKSLGADTVLDYNSDDFTKSGKLYDIVFDAVGKIPYLKREKALAPNGRFVSVMASGTAKFSAEGLGLLRELAESGELKPVVDRTYPWEQIAAAHWYVDTGHKKGNVAITVAQGGRA